MRTTAWAGPGDDLRSGIGATEIPRGHKHASSERGIVGEKTSNRTAEGNAVQTVKSPHVRTAAASRAGDQIRSAVAVDVAGRNMNSTEKIGVVNELIETKEKSSRSKNVENANVRSAACPRSRDDFRKTVAVEIGSRNLHAPKEELVIRVKLRHKLQRRVGVPTKDADQRPQPRSGCRDDIRKPVPIDVCHGRADTASKPREVWVRKQIRNKASRRPIINFDLRETSDARADRHDSRREN